MTFAAAPHPTQRLARQPLVHSLRKSYYKERRVDLAMAQNRWFDLARGGRTAILKATKPSFWESKNELLPVQQTEIDLASGLSQNQGY